MKKTIAYLILLLFTLHFSSCKKFFDVPSTGDSNISPHTVQDLREILNTEGIGATDYVIADLMSDDMEFTNDDFAYTPRASAIFRAYYWQDPLWGPADQDWMYNGTYNSILQMNVILRLLDKVQDGSALEKAEIKSQALINRAFSYFQLVNLYGPAYRTATAATDLGVPIVLEPDGSVLTERASVQAVYDQILSDLQAALENPDLKDMGSDVLHPGRLSGLALRARTQLFMGRYADALTSAEAILSVNHQLLDYSKNDLPLSLIDQKKNPEVLLARVCEESQVSRTLPYPGVGSTLIALLGPKDLRGVKKIDDKLYITKYFTSGPMGMYIDYSLSIPEVILIKAECLARNSDIQKAMDALNLLRTFRFNPGEMTELTATNINEAMKNVFDERRRELFMHGGLRLFDLKRLNLETQYQTTLNRNGLVIPPNVPRYLIPIAPIIIANNPKIKQNKR